MVEKILNNTTPYGKIWASHEGSLHSSTLNGFYIMPELNNKLQVSVIDCRFHD